MEGPELAVSPVDVPLLLVHLDVDLVDVVSITTLRLLDHRWDPDVDRTVRGTRD